MAATLPVGDAETDEGAGVFAAFGELHAQHIHY
jgi:hypothetical protein